MPRVGGTGKEKLGETFQNMPTYSVCSSLVGLVLDTETLLFCVQWPGSQCADDETPQDSQDAKICVYASATEHVQGADIQSLQCAPEEVRSLFSTAVDRGILEAALSSFEANAQ